MNTSKKRRQLIDDAIAAGLHVVEGEHDCLIRRGKTYRSIGVRLWDDGVATRTDIPFALATAIRSDSDIRKLLGLQHKEHQR